MRLLPLLLALAFAATAAPAVGINACFGAPDTGASVCVAASPVPPGPTVCLAAAWSTDDASGSTGTCAGT